MKPLIEMYRDWHNGAARQRLPIGYIEHMPIKEISFEEVYDIMCNLDFNPPLYYGLHRFDWGKVKLLVGEVGHDQMYRYVETPK